MDLLTTHHSPNWDERKLPISLLILHYTGMQTGTAALARLCEAEAKVSAHYLVEEDGRVFQLVPEEKRAWHAGVSYWRGITDVNSASIGIEIVNQGHEFGYHPFPRIQMEAVRDLCQEIMDRHQIPPRNIIGHSDIAPERKQDPGELFDWKWLADEGVGLFPQSTRHKAQSTHLYKWGYNPNANPEAVIAAFQRHYRPTFINGQWDEECGRILAALLEMV
jgi:N-acetylmuramoyl-L-alanine amidase